MKPALPGPQVCTICSGENDKGVKILIQPHLGKIELSTREIDAVVYQCTLCGAVRKEPLKATQAA